MRIDILTACPELLESPLNHSIVQRAKDKGLAEIYVHNLRDFTLDKHRKIDDYAFGFGAGMVLQVEPIDRAISYLTSQRHYDEIIFTAPDGERFTQKEANTLSLKENIIILCGHFKGIHSSLHKLIHINPMVIRLKRHLRRNIFLQMLQRVPALKIMHHKTSIEIWIPSTYTYRTYEISYLRAFDCHIHKALDKKHKRKGILLIIRNYK